jgi:uncharacterized membrane protein
MLILALLVLIISITALRLLGLGQLFPWHDEAYTLLRVLGHATDQGWRLLFSDRILSPEQLLALQRQSPDHGLADTWRELVGHPEHAPLYYLFGWLATRLPLEPLLALRGTAALFGLLLPAAGFWLMRELFGRGPVPWVTALLLACSPLHLLYAQEARQYALWTLLVLASSAALVRALRTVEPLRTSSAVATDNSPILLWALYACLVTFGLYSHLLFVLLLPVHAAYAWLAAAQRSGDLLRPQQLPWRPWLLAVAAAGLLFLPWAIVLWQGLERALDYTAWMGRSADAGDNLRAWGHFLVRSTIDVWPETPPAQSLVLLLPIGAALGLYWLRAPMPQCWLLPLLALAFVAAVLGPDLLFGGVRSIHGRYALPALLAVQLMVAWTLGTMLTTAGAGRWVAVSAIAAMVTLGLVSQQRIGQAETWWTKNSNLSALTPQAVAALHEQPQPFLAVGASELALGQALAVAHQLDARVRVLGVRRQTPPEAIPPDLDQALLLIPTGSVRSALGPGFTITPLGDGETWALAQATIQQAPVTQAATFQMECRTVR